MEHDRPIVILTLLGRNPSLPSLLLNSHMDVVPVNEEKWTHPPFAAEEDDKGNIYGRGAQDMKSVGMAQLHAVHQLRQSGFVFERTIHISFVPDEEIGGYYGMKLFVQSDAFKSLNVGCALDEGIPSPLDTFFIFHGERFIWSVKITVRGNAGHGSVFIQGTAVEKLHHIMGKVYEFRNSQMKKLLSKKDPLVSLGEVTSVNLNILEAGKQINVVPDEASVHLDIRVATDLGEKGMSQVIDEWIQPFREDTTVDIYQKHPPIKDTPIEDGNPWYDGIVNSLKARELENKAVIFPGATDSRYIREAGLPAFGFTPFRTTTPLLHDHDEYLNRNIYLEGISIMKDIIGQLSKEFTN